MSSTLSDSAIGEDLTLEEAYNRALANKRGKGKNKGGAARKLTGPELQAKFATNSSAAASTSDDIAHSSNSEANIAQDGLIEASNSCLSSESEEPKAVVDSENKSKSKKDAAADLTVKDLLDAPKSPIFEVRIRQAEVLRIAGK